MLINDNEYFDVLEGIKTKIREAQYKAVLGANIEMVTLYWNIGKTIIENTKYGTRFLENLSRDIRSEFPKAQGYSVRNLRYMRKFAKTYPDFQKVQHLVALLPWKNNITLMSKLNDENERIWYINKNIENGWNDNVLNHQIDINLYQRQAVTEKVTNFDKTLPSPQSELAKETMKDPYLFDFVEAREDKVENDIRHELVKDITRLLLELGRGFAFVGEDYHIEVEGSVFRLDLLFYHLELRCFIVIELKTGVFRPEHAGKLNFYLSAVDDILRKDSDNPSIGILLCRNKRGLIAEYALRDITKPIGISEYKLLDTLPKEYEEMLPSAEDLEKRIRTKYDIQEEGDEE